MVQLGVEVEVVLEVVVEVEVEVEDVRSSNTRFGFTTVDLGIPG